MNDPILVLGGGGFLGRAIIKALLGQGFKKVACGDLNSDIPGLNIEKIKTDILDPEGLKRSCSPFKTIINCTGQITDPIDGCLMLNSKGVVNLAKACESGGKRIIHISSVSVYGPAKYADENTPVNPGTPYGAGKCLSELLIKEMLPREKTVILRLGNLYGPGQSKGLPAYLRRSFLSDRKLSFDNDGTLLRYYMHLEDCADNIVKVINEPKMNGTFNLIGNEKYTIRELIELLESATGSKFSVKYERQKPPDNIDDISDKKINGLIGVEHVNTLKKLFESWSGK